MKDTNQIVATASTSFDAVRLKEAEITYRKRLRNQPDNMALRLSLAWCLFMQAVHQFGQETTDTGAIPVRGEATGEACAGDSPARSAQALMRDCLHQTYTVKHLSTELEDQMGVARLQALVELTGAQNLAILAEEQSVQKLMALAAAVAQSAECHRH